MATFYVPRPPIDDPWYAKPSGVPLVISAATPGSVNINGVAGTGAAGTVSIQIDTGALTGVEGAGAAGTAVANVLTGALTGVQGAGQVGTLTISGGLVGVQGNGFAGTLTGSVAFAVIGVAGTGQAGTVNATDNPIITGVSGFGQVGTLYPIPPAPTTRPPLFIPATTEGTPASLWLGSTNGNGT